ncbi:carboxypeptidase-like regulatory domain-containing protein, partial [bacterium]|nr:carboxypeptidase-like regulatory domain-containing protein [bacterium]
MLSKNRFGIILLLCISTFLNAQNQSRGIITGRVVDESTGDALIGANVLIKETTLGTTTDFEGNYRINRVPFGTYMLRISYMGYDTREITDVRVLTGEPVHFNVALNKQVLQGEVVTVTASAVQSTEAGLLKMRQKATAVSDAISAEAISRTGSGDAAAAMKKVTGASVIDGKYIYVRGLGERYSTTSLNGIELPSADPDKKSFQMDLLPSGLLENIVTLKTFTPDKPGTFSGGLVDVNIKDFPEKFMLQVSTSAAYNDQTTFNDHFILPNSGKNDWLGMDDGSRDIPVALQADNIEIPRYSSVRTREEAYYLDGLSKSFNSFMSPVSADAPLNQSMSIAFGNQFQLLNQNIGFLGSLTWDQSYSFYDNGVVGRWNMPGPIDEVEGLDSQKLFNDVKGSHQANWGSTFKLSYKNASLGHITAQHIRTQSGESTARYLSGYWQDLPSTATFETRVLSWTERSLNSFQLSGKHRLWGAHIDWSSSLSENEQVEPDQR